MFDAGEAGRVDTVSWLSLDLLARWSESPMDLADRLSDA
jgi:hypothetical protein